MKYKFLNIIFIIIIIFGALVNVIGLINGILDFSSYIVGFIMAAGIESVVFITFIHHYESLKDVNKEN